MRSKEQFKAYVYAKAESEQARCKKRRRLICSGIAACCVCVCVISAAFLTPQNLCDHATAMQPECALAQTRMPETEADAYGATDMHEPSGTQDNFTEDTVQADSNDLAEAAPALKSCLFSASANNTPVGNSLVRTAHYEILYDNISADKSDDTDISESAGVPANESDSGRESIRVAVTAYYLKKPEVSEITVTYSGDAVTVTVFADEEPLPFGSYVYYFTEPLDSKQYHGQPIQLEFRHTSEKNIAKNAR